MQNTVLIALIVVVALFIVHQYDRTLFGLLGRREGFEDKPLDTPMAKANSLTAGPAGGPAAGAAPGAPTAALAKNDKVAASAPATMAKPAGQELHEQPKGVAMPAANAKKGGKEAFADLASFEGPASFASVDAPAGCYPRDQLTPSELLPLDQNSIYAQQNPMGPGSLKGKNFLSAGALIGVNTVGQSLRNANLQLRSEPPNPQVPVSIFQNSTISPDISHRPLEIGA
jgi:hypothetical protein